MTADRSLDLVAPTVECKKVWVKALNILLGQIRHSNMDDAIDDYLEKLWKKADEDRSSTLTYDECCKVPLTAYSFPHSVRSLTSGMGACQVLEEINVCAVHPLSLSQNKVRELMKKYDDVSESSLVQRGALSQRHLQPLSVSLSGDKNVPLVRNLMRLRG